MTIYNHDHHRWIRTGDEVIIARNKEIFVFDRLKVSRSLLIFEFILFKFISGVAQSERLPSGTC